MFRWKRDFRPGIQYHGQIQIGAVYDMFPSPIINVKPYQPGKYHMLLQRPTSKAIGYVWIICIAFGYFYRKWVWSGESTGFHSVIVRAQRVFDWWNAKASDPTSLLAPIARLIPLGMAPNRDLDQLDPMEKLSLLRNRLHEQVMERTIFESHAHPDRQFTVALPEPGTPERELMKALAGHTLRGPYANAVTPNTHISVEDLEKAERGESLERNPSRYVSPYQPFKRLSKLLE